MYSNAEIVSHPMMVHNDILHFKIKQAVLLIQMKCPHEIRHQRETYGNKRNYLFGICITSTN